MHYPGGPAGKKIAAQQQRAVLFKNTKKQDAVNDVSSMFKSRCSRSGYMNRNVSLSVRRSPALYEFSKLLFKSYFLLRYRLHIHGRENFPASGPVIMLPKHQRWTDIPLVGLAALPRPCHYIAKRELFAMPGVRQLMNWLGGIPLDRKQPLKSRDSFRYVDGLLQCGEVVVLFPEGTYYPETMGAGKYRLIEKLVALQEQLRETYSRPFIPFVPVGINYGRAGVRPLVRVMIGQPLFCTCPRLSAEFTKTIMKSIALLSDIRFDAA
jgi:1-acyl-sn-glycerol-3-phosphate acyltransferase